VQKLEDLVDKISVQEILGEDSYTSKFIHMTVPDPSDFGKMCLAFASDEIARLLILSD